MPSIHPAWKAALLWLAWAAILIGFQELVPARLQLQRPDRVLGWTPSETRADSQNDQPYLIDPALNTHVSWDSEFYLSIAATGYDDPNVRTLPRRNRPVISLNYAFFPLYPHAIRLVALPLGLLAASLIGTLTLAGLIVSLLGTLAGMLALYDLARPELEDSGAMRAIFYLLIFPTGFFLAQVYSEGLFVGLAFGSLALLRRKQWFFAAILAVLAVWTRAVGIALVIPFALAWFEEARYESRDWRTVWTGLCALAPAAAMLVWRYSSLGYANALVEDEFFGRGFLLIDKSISGWAAVLSSLGRALPETRVYYGLELALILLALIACLATWRSDPGISAFGLAVLIISLTSGVPQSLGRYVLVIPSIYLFLSRLGKNVVFDRAWSLASVLLMGLSVTLYTVDMWVD